MSPLWIFVTALAGYLLGALPFGHLVARAHGVDIFKEGSGNPGATNVKRVLGEKFGAKGKRAGNMVFALDAFKGAVAALLPRLLNYQETVMDLGAGTTRLVVSTAGDWQNYALIGIVAAVVGHSFSIFTRFKGGKGVATAAGGLIVLIPAACGLAAAAWVVTFFATRFVSLGSILGAVVVIVAVWLLGYSVPVAVVTTVLALLVILRHHANIRRLLAGTEPRFASKSAAGAKPPHS